MVVSRPFVGKLLIAGLVLFSSLAFAQEEPAPAPPAKEIPAYSLRMKLPAGRWLLSQEHQSQSSTTVEGKDVPGQSATLSTAVLLDIQDLPDGGRKIDLEVKSLAMTLEVAKAKMVFDSQAQRGQSPLLKQLVGPLVGAKGTMILNKDGKVSQSAFAEDLWEQVAQNQPQLAEMLKDLKALSASQLSGQEFDGAVAMLPEEAKSVGDTWQRELQRRIQPLGPLNVRYQCRFRELRDTQAGQVARVAFEADVSVAKAGGEVLMGEAKIILDSFTAKQNGTVELFVESKLPSLYDTRQEAESLMRVTDRLGKTRQVSVLRKSRTVLKISAAQE